MFWSLFLLESLWDARLSQMFKWSPEDFNASHHTRKALTYLSWSERLSSMHKKSQKKLKARGQTELYTSQVWKDLESRSLPQLVHASPINLLDLDVHVEPALSACSLAAVVELEAPLTRPVVGATQKYNDRIRHECWNRNWETMLYIGSM